MPTPKPSEFLRLRRPELFSDSRPFEELTVERERLEYYLESITSRSEEVPFEHFCRALCERTICPNLVPQTGPMGGGDAKVDTESHPTAEVIRERWYLGDFDKDGKRRLAFAFSAKKAWKGKLSADVKSILSTQRDYAHIYFVTNQFVPSRERAKVQDTYRKKQGVELTILDRSWLVEKSLDPLNVDIVASKLGLHDLQRTRETSIGFDDRRRLARLEELEGQIADPNRYGTAVYQLVEDCIETALLSRGLGHTRDMVLGRFERARRLAGSNRSQLFRIDYQRAWTLFWWFDELAAAPSGLVDLVNEYGEGASAWELEDMANLWQASQVAGAKSNEFDRAAHALHTHLEKQATISSQPTQALWAKTLLALGKLSDSRGDVDAIAAALRELRAILRQTRDLAEYPVDRLLHWITELIDVLPSNAELLSLAEDAASLESKRVGTAAKVEVYVKVANRLVDGEDPYTALQKLGKAQVALKRNHSADHQTMVWLTSARAYHAAGLLWAARSCLLATSHVKFGELAREGVLSDSAAALMRRLMWIDLRLANAASALQWYSLYRTFALATAASEERRSAFNDEQRSIEVAFAIAALRTPDSELRLATWVPTSLSKRGLPFSSECAKVALGHVEQVAADANVKASEILEVAALALDTDLAHDLPPEFDWRAGATFQIRTRILGVDIYFQGEAERAALLFAEGFVGFIEAMLATTLARQIVGWRSDFRVVIKATDNTALTWEKADDDIGESSITISVPRTLVGPTKTSIEKWIALAAELMSEIALVSDRDDLRNLFIGGDGGFDRAVSLAHVPHSLNDLGSLYPAAPTWPDVDASEPRFAMVRTATLQDMLPPAHGRAQAEGESEQPSALRHDEISVSSLIYTPLWNKAQWHGTVFITAPGLPPVLAPVFKDGEAAQKIFRGLRQRVGAIDTNDRLMVAIVTDIEATAPGHYRVAIATNMKSLAWREGEYWTNIIRMNTMTPATRENLDRFLAAFRESGRFQFLPSRNTASGPELAPSLAIEKMHLEIVPAWTIGPDSLLVQALQSSDHPMIPADQPNAPVLETMDIIRGKTKSKKRPSRWPTRARGAE